MEEIKFGTDGWRAVLNQGFTYKNADKVINAIAIYINKYSGYKKPVIIGFDPRNEADNYAEYIAEKLAKFGFNIKISDKIVATPTLAYSALNQSSYAIMLTASHNPPEYLGIKFIPPYGGPAEDYMVEEIMENLENKFQPNCESKTPEKVSFEDDYIKHLESIIDFEKIQKSGLKINYDGHHGAAAGIFKRILDKHNIAANYQNMERDINFNGRLPDPKEKYLPELKEKCKNTGLIGFSNDGDGDRFGVFDEKGIFISANDIIAMLLNHLVKNKNYTGKLAKTAGSSAMLDIYAKKNNIEVIETPVGFKWLGAAMRNDDIIIAGEESGGLSIKGHIPEKDGILAILLIMEMISFENKKLFQLHNEFLQNFDRDFLNNRIDLKLDSKSEQEKIIEKFMKYKKIGDLTITKTSQIDGYKMYLDDGSWILIRKSGTEPLLRIY
ncbi:MAG: hypothetical protein LUG16_01865, partial [Candidatus Gastranaerophilales bacterium]|nr:hypothetical protein [Candidatus Gastranaerophilales bacterium]